MKTTGACIMDRSLTLQLLLRSTTLVVLLLSAIFCSVPAVADRSSATFMKEFKEQQVLRSMSDDIPSIETLPTGDKGGEVVAARSSLVPDHLDEEHGPTTRKSFLTSACHISPTCMSSRGDDGEEHDLGRLRALLNDVRDISPPGMWPSSENYEYARARRRALLFNIPYISPPGMWPPPDGDEYFLGRRRALLNDLHDNSPPEMWPRGDDDEYVPARRRALLFDIPDISPPGMWAPPDGDENFLGQRRSLLNDPGDIPPEAPEMKPPAGDDDKENVCAGRRALASDLQDVSSPGKFVSDEINPERLSTVHLQDQANNTSILIATPDHRVHLHIKFSPTHIFQGLRWLAKEFLNHIGKGDQVDDIRQNNTGHLHLSTSDEDSPLTFASTRDQSSQIDSVLQMRQTMISPARIELPAHAYGRLRLEFPDILSDPNFMTMDS